MRLPIALLASLRAQHRPSSGTERWLLPVAISVVGLLILCGLLWLLVSAVRGHLHSTTSRRTYTEDNPFGDDYGYPLSSGELGDDYASWGGEEAISNDNPFYDTGPDFSEQT